MQFPKTKIRNLNNITLCWSNVYKSCKEDCIFQLQICDDVKEWKTIYCGPRNEFKADNLAPCTCYNFRIIQKGNNEWLPFKAATKDPGPYTSIIHITRAVRLGKTSVIRKIASIKPLLLNAENKESKTPIFQAIEVKDLQILSLLITLGANVNKPLLHTKRTPLMFAIYKGELQAASFLVDKGADISGKDINGLSILHYAIDSNELSNVQFANEINLDINVQDNNGWTPLLRAVILQSNQKIIEYLLFNGANKQIKDKNGFDYQKHLEISKSFQHT